MLHKMLLMITNLGWLHTKLLSRRWCERLEGALCSTLPHIISAFVILQPHSVDMNQDLEHIIGLLLS